jgi:hypothetical protein
MGSATASATLLTDPVSLLGLVTVPAPLLLLGLAPQCLEAGVPELLEEGPQLAEPLGPRAVQATGTFPPLDQQTGVSEHPQVLRYRRPRHVREVPRYRPGRQLAVSHEAEDPPTPRLGNGVQHCLHGYSVRLGLRKFNLTISLVLGRASRLAKAAFTHAGGG